MKNLKGWWAAVFLGAMACAPVAGASEEAEPVPDDVGAACAAVAEGISILTGYLIGREFGDLGKTISVHLAAKYGPDVVTKRCHDYYRSLEKQKNEFDYGHFVETVCGGNPYTCPNGWNPLGGLPGNPADCHMYIVCNLSLAVGSDSSLSVQDMLSASAFIDLSYRRGYWDYENFGYLVGVSGVGSSFAIH